MGVSWEEFWRMNPRIVRLLSEGHKEKIREMDYLAWMFNQYTLTAVTVGVERNLAGKKAKLKYMEKPLMEVAREQAGDFTEEELQRKRELFVANLQAMKANFDLNHKKARG